MSNKIKVSPYTLNVKIYDELAIKIRDFANEKGITFTYAINKILSKGVEELL